ncbi:MAG: hypothetical protein KatS3mg001_515 [Candidatus Pacearchaeota archaeon]|nr:MAG: hypothetical protein KatS3mg001_515 [Candidatus Pacearchaeota archaeon]
MTKKLATIGIISGIVIVLISLLFIKTNFFFFIFGIGIAIAVLPYIISVVYETKVEAEKEEMFLEFARNLVESVKTGTPINKSIINVKNKNYGVLTPHIQKLANQIALGIPLNKALETFAHDVGNKTISRSITLIGQAERSGGEIGGILESVTEAVTITDKLKKERKAAISSIVAEGYIIFLVFIAIILVLQFQIIPLLGNIGSSTQGLSIAGFGLGGGKAIDPKDISNSFLYLLLVQGFFSGLAIGKLSEGTIKPGIKHSFLLMIIAFLIAAGANAFFG